MPRKVTQTLKYGAIMQAFSDIKKDGKLFQLAFGGPCGEKEISSRRLR